MSITSRLVTDARALVSLDRLLTTNMLRRHFHAPAPNHSILPNPPPTAPSKASLSVGDEPALLPASDSLAAIGAHCLSLQLSKCQVLQLDLRQRSDRSSHANAKTASTLLETTCFADLLLLAYLSTGRTYGGGQTAESQWGAGEESQAWRALVPPFVKAPPPGKVTREALRYLRLMGALELPSPALEKQLLLAYIEHVHPDFPVMELHDFLRRVSDRSGRHGQVSLLLYQSAMFAASAFIKSEYLAAAGFPNRRALRRAIFQAAKLLYDFDYENDKFTLVQSTFLLSFWYEAPDDSKETWHWSGIAISQAQALGLHRSNVNASSVDPVKRRQRRRIWWSCVMRDRQIGLGMSRLIRIKDEDFDIPELHEDDFQIETLDDNPVISRKDCPLVYDVGMQQELAEMCVQKSKLYVLVGHVLQAVQSFQVATSNRTRSVAAIIEGNLEIFESVHRELVAWAAALPKPCRYRTLQRVEIEQGRTAVAMQRTLLHMLYHTTVGKVYHPLVRPPRLADPRIPAPEPTAEQHISIEARQKCKVAAAEITRMAAEMHGLDLDRYFPTTGVTVIMPAMLMHLQDVSDPVKETREEAQRGFDTCMSVLNTLRETYAAAEFAAVFMDNVIRNKPGLERPGPPTGVPAGPNPGEALSAAPPSQPYAGQDMSVTMTDAPRAGAYAMIQPRELDGGLRQQSHGGLHPGLNEMGLANLPVMSQSPMVGGLTSQELHMPATFPESTTLLAALGTATATTLNGTAGDSAAPDSWPIEVVTHRVTPSDGGSASTSPENMSEGYTLVGDSSEGIDETTSTDFLSAEAFCSMGPGGDISAEGLSFPQFADDGWQKWLNLPESDMNGDGCWASAPEHIDPGALNPSGAEVFG